MSWYESYHERISIVNDCEATAKLIEGLKDYLQSVNHMEHLESVRISRLALSDGESTVLVEDVSDVEFGNTWVMTPEGLRQRQAEHVLWREDHPLMQMLERLEDARQVTLEWSVSMMALLGSCFGSPYWRKLIKDPVLKGRVDYMMMTSNDFSEDACIICDDGSGTFAEAPRNASLDALRDIPMLGWHNFKITMEHFPEEAWATMEERLKAVREAFVARFDCSYLELDIWEGSVDVISSLMVEGDRLEEFRDHVQKFVDVGASYGVDAQIQIDLVPYGVPKGGFAPFAAVKFECVDGKVVTRAFRYAA